MVPEVKDCEFCSLCQKRKKTSVTVHRIRVLLPKAISDAECDVQIACKGDLTDSSEYIGR